MTASPIVMTRLLAEMQTSILAAALPLFDRRVDRFIVYVLTLRQTLRGAEGGTPILSLSSSLGLPFETARRHVRALTTAKLVERDVRGIVATDAWRSDPAISALAMLSHDAFVRFVEEMQAVTALPRQGRSNSIYDWRDGLQAAVDLMLAVAETNRSVHGDVLDLVLFSTILCANYRDTAAGKRRPIGVSRLARILSLPVSTVQRRTARLCCGSIEAVDGGLAVSERWMASPDAQQTSAATHANVRRLLLMLEAKGFPFEAPADAYRNGRPPMIALA